MIVSVPAATAVITPVLASTVAIVVLLLDHVPPAVVSVQVAVEVPEPTGHIELTAPDIAPGVLFSTVTVVWLLHNPVVPTTV